MTKSFTKILSLALVAGALATPLAAPMAFAQAAPAVQPAPGISFSDAIGVAEAKGYLVTEAEAERGHFDIEARAADGRKFDIRIDAATGQILREREDR